MAQNKEPFNRLSDKIENTKEDLRTLIDECVKKSDYQDQQKYYATKAFALTLGGTLIALLCSAYWLVTPIIVKNENNQFITKLEEAIGILQSNYNMLVGIKYDKYKIQNPQKKLN